MDSTSINGSGASRVGEHAVARWRLSRRLLALLKQGLTPDKLALCIAIGITCGLFPVFGTTTFLCIAAASVFRLNQAAIQLVNYSLYPVYAFSTLALLEGGAWLFREPRIPLSASGLRLYFAGGLVAAAKTMGVALLHASVLWLLLAPISVLILYLPLQRVITAMASKLGHQQ